MATILRGFVLLCLIMMVSVVTVLQSKLILPMKYSKPTQVTAQKMQSLGFPKSLATSVVFAAQRTNLEPDFLVALIFTESNFDVKAVSSKGYHGLGQIAYKIYDPDTNLLITAKMFNEKLAMAKGDVVRAIVLYKGYGGDYARGKLQAEKVLSLYHRLRHMEVENVEPI